MAFKTIEPAVPSCQVQTQRPIIKVTFGVHTVTSVSLERSVGNGRLAMARFTANAPQVSPSCTPVATSMGPAVGSLNQAGLARGTPILLWSSEQYQPTGGRAYTRTGGGGGGGRTCLALSAACTRTGAGAGLLPLILFLGLANKVDDAERDQAAGSYR